MASEELEQLTKDIQEWKRKLETGDWFEYWSHDDDGDYKPVLLEATPDNFRRALRHHDSNFTLSSALRAALMQLTRGLTKDK